MVASFTGLLDNKYGEQFDETARGYMTHVIDGAKRMQALLNGLLDFSRVGTRGGDIVPDNAASIVNEAIDNLTVLIAENGAEVSVGDLPEIDADHGQMVRVFQNLIANAIKFRREEASPRIKISAERVEGFWEFSIEDNGIGIDPQYFDRIFAIFQRLHKRGEYPGEGIGLAVTKRIVERHGGKIWVESRPDEGAVFHLTVPAASYAVAPKRKEGDLVNAAH